MHTVKYWDKKLLSLQRMADSVGYDIDSDADYIAACACQPATYAEFCKMLAPTSESKTGDIFHIYKNDFGYLAFNTNTGKYFYCFPSMLRDVNICQFLEVT